MENVNPAGDRYVHGVMVSSTFADLKNHRAAITKALKAQGLTDVMLENDSATEAIDVMDSSLQMVRDCSAYIAIIGHKYGLVPESPERNPNRLSLTELEFKEAQRLGRPMLIFIMGDDHPVRLSEIERDIEKLKKLDAFKESIKRLRPDSSVLRIYAVFNNLEGFEVAAITSAAELRRYLDFQSKSLGMSEALREGSVRKRDSIATPPDLYAKPAYVGSHYFVGRQAELERLSDWAAAADPHPILLFHAIGGAGKSMLSWEWTTNHAASARGDWAGRFWYSFYEKGALMTDFCRRANAYISGRPLEDFRRMKMRELSERLLHHLQSRPWLLVLDGLERVLVAYHSFDAAELRDEEALFPDDIDYRDPCSAIRPADDDLLSVLASAAPSKILITSRLFPRVLLNQSRQPIPGVLRVPLGGLRPTDAEALLRASGITGSSHNIQHYLKSNCDCHPLVTGLLAGLINDYLPSRGNFDDWVNAPSGGGSLSLADLDLVQRRNHILHAALAALPEKSRQLLSMLALLSESVDYSTLEALNPYQPAKPNEVEKPLNPENHWQWAMMSDNEKEQALQGYRSALRGYEEYEANLTAWRESAEFRSAAEELVNMLRDLERRGLLQYDHHARRFGLHPVVRGVAAGTLLQDEKTRYGERVIEHFSRQSHIPYDEAESFDDLRDGIQVLRTLLEMGRYEQAAETYKGDLSRALLFNLEAYAKTLSLLRPFFPHGWATLPDCVSERDATALVNDVAYCLSQTGDRVEALAAFRTALLVALKRKNWREVRSNLASIAVTLSDQNRLAKAESVLRLALEVATLDDSEEILFVARLDLFQALANVGKWDEAEAIWELLNPMGRQWGRSVYRPGAAEYLYCQFLFWRGDLREDLLDKAEELARAGRSHAILRWLHRLRGEWQIERRNWELAADSFNEAVRMAREVGQADTKAEAQLALAKLHLNQLRGARTESERIANASGSNQEAFADLWFAIGDVERAKKYATAAYEWAWADGEPYVRRYQLDHARSRLEMLGAEVPDLPGYDTGKDEKFLWESEVAAVIEKQYAGPEGAAILAGRWVDYLHGRRSRYSLPTLAKGFPAFRIVQFKLKNIGVFIDTGVVDFADGPILLLGNNAAGKSTILKCLALAAIGSEAANEVEDNAASYLRIGTSKGTIEVVFDLIPRAGCEPVAHGRFAVGLGIDSNSGRFTPLPYSEMTLSPPNVARNCVDQINSLRNENNFSFGFICAYGATRSFSDNRFALEPEHSKRENEWVLSLFQANVWLTNPDNLSKLLRGDTRNIKDAPEQLRANVAEALQTSLLQLLPNAQKLTSDNDSDITLNDVPLRFGDLSEGYRSVLAFIGHMVRCELRLTAWDDDPFKVYGIALVDEIESHLHPAWQRHIIADLHRLFPNVQWICSSHSPLVAGALAPNSILLLESRGDHVIPQPINQSFQGWRADQILTSLLFGLNTSRDEETSLLLQRYRELAVNKMLSPIEEEEFSALGRILGVRVPTIAEREEAREAMKIFDVTLNDLLDKRSAEEIQRINDELLLRIQNALSD